MGDPRFVRVGGQGFALHHVLCWRSDPEVVTVVFRDQECLTFAGTERRATLAGGP